MKPFWEKRVGIVLDRAHRPDLAFVSEFTQDALEFWQDIKGQL
jgi:hypothetical protein